MTPDTSSQPAHSAMYNIKAVVTQTGLNPATIRAWERRYGLPNPERTEGGHRQYSQRDVDTIKWLTAQQDEGMSISHAVDLWHSLVEKGEDPLQEKDNRDSGLLRGTLPALGQQTDELREAWIEACLSFDREAAELILTHAFSLYPPEVVCIELLQKGLVEIGDGWHKGLVTVQQEHFATSLSEQRLEILIAATAEPTRPERIIVAAAPGERHTFGAYLLTYLLRRQGWDVIHLGADVPAEDFGPTIAKLRPDLVIVSAQLFNTAASLMDIARETIKHEVILAYGGGIFNRLPEIRARIPGFFVGESLQQAVEKTAELLAKRPTLLELPEPDQTHQKALAQFEARQSLIESHVWRSFVSANIPNPQLPALNDEMAMMITSALKLGSINLLGYDLGFIEDWWGTYHIDDTLLYEHTKAYYQGAKIHLGEGGRIIVDWLQQLAADAAGQ